MLNKKTDTLQWLQRNQRHKHSRQLCSQSQAVGQKGGSLYLGCNTQDSHSGPKEYIETQPHTHIFWKVNVCVLVYYVLYCLSFLPEHFVLIYTLHTYNLLRRNPRVIQTGFTPSTQNSVPWLILLSCRTPSPSPCPHLIRAPHNYPSATPPCWGPGIYRWTLGTLFKLCSCFLSSPHPVYCEPTRL